MRLMPGGGATEDFHSQVNEGMVVGTERGKPNTDRLPRKMLEWSS